MAVFTAFLLFRGRLGGVYDPIMPDYTLENTNRLKILRPGFPVQDHIVTLLSNGHDAAQDMFGGPTQHPILQKPSVPVNMSAFRKDAMVATMLKMGALMHAAGGVGLSAVQVGIRQTFFVRKVTEHNPARGRYRLPLGMIINMEVLAASEEDQINPESCLSIPGYACLVRRPQALLVRYILLTPDGKLDEREEWIFDYEACIGGHEGDHGLGVLIFEKAVSPNSIRPIQDYHRFLAMNMSKDDFLHAVNEGPLPDDDRLL